MENKPQGITVEIDGDASGLEKSLNKSIEKAEKLNSILKGTNGSSQNGDTLPYMQKNETVQRIIRVLKDSDKNISYLQAADVLESMIEKLSSFSLFKN